MSASRLRWLMRQIPATFCDLLACKGHFVTKPLLAWAKTESVVWSNDDWHRREKADVEWFFLLGYYWWSPHACLDVSQILSYEYSSNRSIEPTIEQSHQIERVLKANQIPYDVLKLVYLTCNLTLCSREETPVELRSLLTQQKLEPGYLSSTSTGSVVWSWKRQEFRVRLGPNAVWITPAVCNICRNSFNGWHEAI
jgi:hypothetical protein